MDLGPLKKTRFYSSVIERIKDSIESGELRPGAKLPSERELAAGFSISRTAVREAISALEFSGSVEVRPGVGIFLVDTNLEEIIAKVSAMVDGPDTKLIEMLELRQAVESQAAYLAASRATRQQKLNIREAYRNLEGVVTIGEMGAREDLRFHLSVVLASGNQMLEQVIELVSGRFEEGLTESRMESLSVPGQSKKILLEHKEILAAIEASEPERSRDSMWRHLENVRIRYL